MLTYAHTCLYEYVPAYCKFLLFVFYFIRISLVIDACSLIYHCGSVCMCVGGCMCGCVGGYGMAVVSQIQNKNANLKLLLRMLLLLAVL